MRHRSLTSHVALMCMLVCSLVLLLDGLYVQLLSRSYFNEADRRSLLSELDGMQLVLGRASGRQQLGPTLQQLGTLLEVHPRVRAWLYDADGGLLLTTDALISPPLTERARPDREMWLWTFGKVTYHAMHQHIRLADGAQIHLTLALDTRTHRDFLWQLQLWMGGSLLVLGLCSGLIGRFSAQRIMQPLYDLARMARSIAPSSLHRSIKLEAPPQELRPLVEALNEMLGRLEDAFARLQYFSSDLAHELRTPVATLMGRTEVTLSRVRSAEAYQEALYSNLEALRNMSRLIDDMLFLARADNGRLVPHRERIWVQELLHDLLDYYELLAEDAGVRIEQHGNAWVDGDPAMLRRAISNLLSNAIRYTPAGQCIRIEVSQQEQGVGISVCNPGHTIPPDQLARLFERFYRADASRREGQANVGLGLSITRSIVESHGGSITCTSVEGLTCFTLLLPLAAGRPRMISEPPQ